jgi:integrase
MSTRKLSPASVPPPLAGPIAVSVNGVPRFWGEIYTHLVLSHQARSTRTKRISYIDDLYEYADSAHGAFALDRAITNVDFGCLSRILHGYLVHLNNRSSTNDIDGSSRWDAAINFVRRTIELFGSGSLAEAARVTTALEELKYQYGALRPLTRKKPLMPRALRSPIVRALYRIFDPESPDNPFRGEKNRYRNNLLFLILLHLGLRTGEAMALPVDPVMSDVHPETGQVIYWISIRENMFSDYDSRYEEPGLKTVESNRLLPLAQPLVRLIQGYQEGYRHDSSSPFLVTSEHGGPLSLPSVRYIFARAHKALPDELAQQVELFSGKKISSYDLRHTCAVFKLRQLKKRYDHDDALLRLRRWFGWSPNSRMPARYASAYLEEEAESGFREDFEAYTESLYSLSRGCGVDD